MTDILEKLKKRGLGAMRIYLPTAFIILFSVLILFLFTFILAGLLIQTSLLPTVKAENNFTNLEKSILETEKDQTFQRNFEKCWSNETNEEVITQIASDNENNIYLFFENGELHSIDYKTGEKNWMSELGGEFISEAILEKNEIYVASRVTQNAEELESPKNAGNGKTAEQPAQKEFDTSHFPNKIFIRAINKNTGLTKWQTHLEFSKENHSKKEKEKEQIFLQTAKNYLVGYNSDGSVYWIDKANGQIVRKFSLPDNLNAKPLLENENALIRLNGEKLLEMSLSDGKISPYPHLFNYAGNFLLNEGKIFTGSDTGILTSRDRSNGKRNWQIRLGARISDITFAGPAILVSSLDNFVYFVSKENGKILWKRRFADRLLFRPVIYGNLILISPYSSNEITFLEKSTGKIVNRLFLPEGNYIVNNSLQLNDFLIVQTLREVSAFSAKGCSAK